MLKDAVSYASFTLKFLRVKMGTCDMSRFVGIYSGILGENKLLELLKDGS
ncbi:hypothetical protein PA25_22360 [Pseudoalteromonas sp. A25]|nr:hypothetical protein PA25_22360 [Pseudoalteromonas sp. A25]